MTMSRGTDRLDKAISAQTTLSRKDVHKLLSRGLVLVNGVAARNFDSRVDPEHDQVTVEGQPLLLKQYSYIMLNKPRGVVSATSDAVLPTVLDLLPQELRRTGLFPAGRLDKDTTGFVLITNDGDFAHRILAPKSHVSKIYTATLDLPVTDEMMQAFAAGVAIAADKHDENDREAPARRENCICMPAVLTCDPQNPLCARIVIRQGMYHQIKRMFGAFGREVLALHREQIGGLALDPTLPEGKCRELFRQEVEKMTENPAETMGVSCE